VIKLKSLRLQVRDGDRAKKIMLGNIDMVG
jgi:hypothetical protein